MRIDSLNTLRSLLDEHQYPSIALGDFNINQKEDSQLGIYASQEKSWSIAHLVGCDDCKGTHYYSMEIRGAFWIQSFYLKIEELALYQIQYRCMLRKQTHIVNFKNLKDLIQ